MKIRQVQNRINASYNTIKKFVETDPSFFTLEDNIIHVTKLGIEKLETKYGLKSEILTDHEIVFYKNQLKFMEQQLHEFKQYNQLFLKQLDSSGEQISERDEEIEKKNLEIEELKKEIVSSQLEKINLEHQLDMERSKSFFKRILKK